MPAATPRRRKEVEVTIAFGQARRRVWMRADRNAAAALRSYVDGFMREAVQEELAEIARAPAEPVVKP
jgi:hypothetical protein